MNDKTNKYTIKTLSEESGLPVSTINHYLNIDLLKEKDRAENNYRLFGRKELQKLKRISDLRVMGFSTQQIKRQIQKRGSNG